MAEKIIQKHVLALLVFLTIFCQAAFAQSRRPTVIRIASLAPERTPWGEALNKLAADWKRATNGEVELLVFHNAVQGSEEDVLRKLRLNQLQGGVFTSIGLNSITPEALTISCPFLIRNEEELDLVLKQVRPDLEKHIEDKGFVPIAWSKGGWVKIFSKRPVFVPSDLRVQKLGSSASEVAMTQAFKTLGYQMIPIGMNDILISLTSGMVDAVYQSPIAIVGMQAFASANNMSTLNIAPFIGGILLTRNAWRSVPDKYKPALAALHLKLEQDLDASIIKLEERAITEMAAHGLVINKVSPEQEKIWYDDVERAMPSLLGTTFDRYTYLKIDGILKTYRAGR